MSVLQFARKEKVKDVEKFRIDEKGAENMLRPVMNKPVGIISVAGVTRKGKSFLLNFFIEYLAKNEGVQQQSWFTYRGGISRETTGIHVWKTPYYRQRIKTHAFLMDSQGIFDTKSSQAENTFFFSLTTLLSTTLIYNLSIEINDNDIQNLGYFAENARVGSDDESQFGTIIFLIRDFRYWRDHGFGWKGGESYIEELLADSPESQTAKTLKSIKKLFKRVKFYAMPHPGEEIDQMGSKSGFSNAIKLCKPEFLKQMREFVKDVCDVHFKPFSNFNGSDVMYRAKIFAKNFEKSPTTETMLASFEKSTATKALEECFMEYRSLMKSRGMNSTENEVLVKSEHLRCSNEVIAMFGQQRVKSHLQSKYRNQLKENMDLFRDNILEEVKMRKLAKERQILMDKLEKEKEQMRREKEKETKRVKQLEKEVEKLNARKDVDERDKELLKKDLEHAKKEKANIEEKINMTDEREKENFGFFQFLGDSLIKIGEKLWNGVVYVKDGVVEAASVVKDELVAVASGVKDIVETGIKAGAEGVKDAVETGIKAAAEGVKDAVEMGLKAAGVVAVEALRVGLGAAAVSTMPSDHCDAE